MNLLTSGRPRRPAGDLRGAARGLTIRCDAPAEGDGARARGELTVLVVTAGGGGLGRIIGDVLVLPAFPMPLGSESERGLAGP